MPLAEDATTTDSSSRSCRKCGLLTRGEMWLDRGQGRHRSEKKLEVKRGFEPMVNPGIQCCPLGAGSTRQICDDGIPEVVAHGSCDGDIGA